MVKRVCAWCDKLMGYAPFEAPDPRYNITHGICIDCKEQIMSSRKKPLHDFLNRFEEPIYALNDNMMVKASNQSGMQYINKPLKRINNKIAGEVLGCVFASSAGGCGNQSECKNCILRNSVNETFAAGKGVNNISTELKIQTPDGFESTTISITTEKVGDIVFLQINNPVEA